MDVIFNRVNFKKVVKSLAKSLVLFRNESFRILFFQKVRISLSY